MFPSHDRGAEFFSVYPLVQFQNRQGTGDGTTTAFSGTLSSKPVLRNNVYFTSIDANNTGLEVHDDGSGLLITSPNIFAGTIDYVTGVYSFNFQTPPAASVPVYSQTVPYVPNIPESMLFFDNNIILRPVPAQVYSVTFEVYVKPTELITSGQSPLLHKWWQYIAYGAAKKLFEDRSDNESVAQIMGE